MVLLEVWCGCRGSGLGDVGGQLVVRGGPGSLGRYLAVMGRTTVDHLGPKYLVSIIDNL